MTIQVVLPVYNEERSVLATSEIVHAFFVANPQHEWEAVIADNASIDGTPDLGKAIASKYDEFEYLRIERKGRGAALREAWQNADSQVVAYTDIDLSTSLRSLIDAAELIERGADIVVGNRVHPESIVKRSLQRTIMSRIYNFVARKTLGLRFNDVHCGFKSGRRTVIQGLLTEIEDDYWFFDTELLYLAQRKGLKNVEIPVVWEESDSDSALNLLGLYRLAK